MNVTVHTTAESILKIVLSFYNLRQFILTPSVQMSFPFRIASYPLRGSIHNRKQDVDAFVGTSIHTVSLPFYSPHLNFPRRTRNYNYNSGYNTSTNQRFPCHLVGAGGETGHGISDSQSSSAELEGSMAKDTQQGRSMTTTKILEQLRRYGVSGILSYGLLNTAYYLTAFLVVWFYFAPVPGRMGYLAAVSRFLKIMAMVWAGSQVTKLLRAAGALALAPFVDKGLSWFTVRFKFESRGKAFFAVVGFCLGLAIILFLVVTLLWA